MSTKIKWGLFEPLEYFSEFWVFFRIGPKKGGDQVPTFPTLGETSISLFWLWLFSALVKYAAGSRKGEWAPYTLAGWPCHGRMCQDLSSKVYKCGYDWLWQHLKCICTPSMTTLDKQLWFPGYRWKSAYRCFLLPSLTSKLAGGKPDNLANHLNV